AFLGGSGNALGVNAPAATVNPAFAAVVVPASGTNSVATANRPEAGSTVPVVTKPQVQDHSGKPPLSFEANQGQTDSQVRFLARGAGYPLFLPANDAVLVSHPPDTTPPGQATEKGLHHHGLTAAPQQAVQPSPSAVVHMQMLGANPAAQITGNGELAGKVNYFLGHDASDWHTNIPTFSQVEYHSVYQGIDLVYYGTGQQLEYDFVVHPG